MKMKEGYVKNGDGKYYNNSFHFKSSNTKIKRTRCDDKTVDNFQGACQVGVGIFRRFDEDLSDF